MLTISVAVAENNIIGGDNKLLWHISEDLKRFKTNTMNSTIIMGRKTFESLPKVLPGRTHIVITKDPNFKVDSDMVKIYHNIDDVINEYENSDEEAFVIGGGQIYNLLFPHCKKLLLTKVKQSFKGDTYFPEINFNEWTITYSSGEKVNPEDNIVYEFIDLIKK